MTEVFDDRQCTLGEGPLWHPIREDLFWFDIIEKRLHSKAKTWQFDEYVSAAGWVTENELLIASQTQLFRFDLETGAQTKVCDMEANNPITRSNDGRADPQGGFWIGTMGIQLEEKAGAIYRFYKGELRKLYPDISIPNSICFAPGGGTAYFTDTPTKQIMGVALDADGWPKGDPWVAVDLTTTGENPDGSVVDTAGNIWNAQWGAGRMACYSPDGTFIEAVKVGGLQATCPAFAGETGTLYCTSAAEGIDGPNEGKTFVAQVNATGQKEHQVIL